MAGVSARSTLPHLAHVHEGEPEPEPGVDPLHQPLGAAVDVVPADDVVAAIWSSLSSGVERGQSGAEGEAVLPPSRLATLRSSASRVGFWVRAYS